MKIWILTSESPFYNPGGIARYVDNFARYLAQADQEVLVLCRGDEAADREIVPGYRFVSYIPAYQRLGQATVSNRPDEHPGFPYNLFDYWTALSFEMAALLPVLMEKHGPPDIIECQEYGALAYYLLQRRLTEPGYLEGIPVVLNIHSPDFILREVNEEPRFQFPAYWNGRMELASLYAADALICPSRFLSDQIEAVLDDPDYRVDDIALPWTDVSSHMPNHPGQGDVVYLGRLEVRKGVLRLCEAAERMWRQGLDFRLTLIGGDTQFYPKGTTVGTYLEQTYAKRLESGQLVLAGNLRHGEVLERVGAASFVVIPSLWENWPNTCIEAMSLEKMVVASRHGGQAEMVGPDEACGFLFDWQNEGEFDRQFARALRLSPERLVEMGKNAQARIAGLCHPDVILPRRIDHFQKVIREARRPRRFPFTNRHLRHSPVHRELAGSADQQGLVSIVVPYYNLGTYLQETIDSILASNYGRMEILIINDGSDDPESLEILDPLRSDQRGELRVIDMENQGLANARNVGAKAATGEFLLFLDADDCIEPTFISRCVRVLQDFDNVHIVYSWERYFDGSDSIFPGWNFEFPYLLGHNMTAPLCVLRRAAFLAHGRNKRKMTYNFEDYESWISMVAAGCGGVCLHEPLVRYRIRRNSIWQASSRDQHLFLWDLIVKEHPDLYRKYGPDLFALQNANGPCQEWIKPSAPSPHDQYKEWSTGEIAHLRRVVEDKQKEIDWLKEQLGSSKTPQ